MRKPAAANCQMTTGFLAANPIPALAQAASPFRPISLPKLPVSASGSV